MAKKKAPKANHPLQELREAIGLKRDEFATRIGRSRPLVALVETGRAELGRATVLRIFDTFRDDLNRLGITAEDLLRGTRERTNGDASAA